MTIFKQFLADERGAVSVDWVVLTGSVVFFAVFGVTFLRDPVLNMVNEIALEMFEFKTELDAE